LAISLQCTNHRIVDFIEVGPFSFSVPKDRTVADFDDRPGIMDIIANILCTISPEVMGFSL
jgi:hypothetical protein